MKILGLDVGEKSCGIAISNNMILANGKENFFFIKKDWQKLIDHLENKYLKNIKKIIIGYPLLKSGDKSKTTLMIDQFKKQLEKRTKIKILFFNEYGSTKKANDIMIDVGFSRKKRKKNKDKLAATIILQNYLDKINESNNN